MNRNITISLRYLFSACAAAAIFTGSTSHAAVVDLGAASGFSVLALDGKFDSSDSAFQYGDIGVASAGFSYTQTGGGQTNTQQPITAFIHTGSTVGNHPAVVTIDMAHDALLNQAIIDAHTASTNLAALATTDNIGAVNSGMTISKGLGNYVLSITSINLNQSALTLNAPKGSTFVLNISGSVTLNGGSQGGLLITGGLTTKDVVYNFTGSGGLVTSGGGNAQVVQGIVLAVNSAVELHPGEVDGQIISKSFSSSSGALVLGPIPEVSTFLPLGLVLGAVVGANFLRRRRASSVEYAA